MVFHVPHITEYYVDNSLAFWFIPLVCFPSEIPWRSMQGCSSPL